MSKCLGTVPRSSIVVGGLHYRELSAASPMTGVLRPQAGRRGMLESIPEGTHTLRRVPIPDIGMPVYPDQPVTTIGLPALPGPYSYDRKMLWERVVATQYAPRVGAKREKSLAIITTVATMGAVASILALAGAASHGSVGIVALPLLAGTNFTLGLVSGGAAVATFRHTRPARPGALRRHSFHLTNIVSTRTQARSIVNWLTEQNFVGEGRQRPVLVSCVRASELIQRGLLERFAYLSAEQVEKIANTLSFVQVVGTFATQTPPPPQDVHGGARAIPPPWQPRSGHFSELRT